MKILIEESVLRQALETFTHCYAETDRRINERAKILVELRTVLDAAEKVEPMARVTTGEWISQGDGTWLGQIESHIPLPELTPLYTHPAPAVSEKVEPVAWKEEFANRKLFESVAKVCKFDVTRLGGVYLNTSTQNAWELWRDAHPAPETAMVDSHWPKIKMDISEGVCGTCKLGAKNCDVDLDGHCGGLK